MERLQKDVAVNIIFEHVGRYVVALSAAPALVLVVVHHPHRHPVEIEIVKPKACALGRKHRAHGFRSVSRRRLGLRVHVAQAHHRVRRGAQLRAHLGQQLHAPLLRDRH